MTHDFDPRSMFCSVCDMPMRALAEHRDLDTCTPENAARWTAIEAQEAERRVRIQSEIEASRMIDAEPLPPGTTWGDIRRALGLDRWTA